MNRIAIATSLTDPPGNDVVLMKALRESGFDVDATIWSDKKRRWKEFAAVVIRSCWNYHLRHFEFLEWVADLERTGVPVINRPELIRWNAHKSYLAELEHKGIRVPETVFLEDRESADLGRICTLRNWSEAVVKPLVSASAFGTHRRSEGVVNGPAMVQRYEQAVEFVGEWSLVYFDHTFSHAVIKKPAANDFRVQSAFGGIVEAADPGEGLLLFGESVLALLPCRSLFARVDVIADRGDAKLMEVEVIEPDLFLAHGRDSADRFASSIRTYLNTVCGVRHRGIEGCRRGDEKSWLSQ